MRGLWSRAAFTFEGQRYRTVAADLEPKPGHDIPVWLGTFGDRALAVTGRLADGWIPSLGYVSATELIAMRARVLAAASEAGREASQITCALNLQVQVDERAAAASVVAGPPGAVAAQLAAFVRAGFTALNFMTVGGPADEQAERLAREVLPEVAAST
jgi:alkanesulfonate monooxygenase SsuD/methylene tetrahydromethanopterin reductase-like flavin-dependent oxidoreductase (luciferase family)